MAFRMTEHPLPIDLVEQLVKLSAVDGTPAVMSARISDDRAGAGLGAARQLRDQVQLYERLGLRLVGVFVDNDISAYSGRPRPDYLAMLEALKQDFAQVVTAWHTDRIHRSPRELEEYIDICHPRGVVTHTVRTGPIDLSTPSGRMIARQLGAYARYESEHKAERQVAKKIELANAGKYRGGPRPYGWERDGVTEVPAEVEVLRDAGARAMAGEGLQAIANELNAAGKFTSTGKQWTGASLKDVLMRARNAGLIERHGEIIGDAVWDGVFTEEFLRALRAKLTDPARRNSTSTKLRWLGSGLYLCGVCDDGTKMGIGSTHSTRRKESAYKPAYKCRQTPHLTRIAEPVDELVEEVVVARLSRPDAVELMQPSHGVDVSTLHVEATSIRVRLDEQATLHAQGLIDTRQLVAGSKELQQQLAAIDRQIEAATANSALVGVVGADDVARVWFGTAADRSDGLSIDRRRAIIDAVMEVRIMPTRPGRKPDRSYFDPASVDISWRV
jgi:site-specific DNA recombinase